MFWVYFLSCLIVAALVWCVFFLCTRAVFLSLAPAATERKNIIRAAQRTALVLPVSLGVDFVVVCLQEKLYTFGIISALLLVGTLPFVACFSLRCYACFSWWRAIGAALLLEVLTILLFTGGLGI